MPESRSDDVGGGKVQVRARRNDQRIFTARLGQQRQVPAPGAEEPGGVICAGQDDPVHVRVGNQVLADGSLFDVGKYQHVAGDAGVPQGLNHDGGAPLGLGCRFQDHGASGGQWSEDGSGRNGNGEVPRRGGHGQRGRNKACTLHLVQLFGEKCVVVGEVDRLRNLRVGLRDGLPGFACRDLHEVTPAGSKLGSRSAEHHRPLRTGPGRPVPLCCACRPDGGIHLTLRIEPGGLDQGNTQGGTGNPVEDAGGPRPDSR